MPKSRASIFEQDEDLDLSAFQPKPVADPTAPIDTHWVPEPSSKTSKLTGDAKGLAGAAK